MNERIKVTEAYAEFVREKKANNVSSKTLETYDLHIQNFIQFYEMDKLACCLLNKDIWTWWLESLQKSGTKKDVTIASYARSVRAFLYWCMDSEYCPEFHLELPKYQKKPKATYTDEEMSILLKHRSDFTEVQYQTWVFINLIASTGLRLSTALDMHVSDINFKTKEVRCNYTKNNLGQLTFLNDNVLSIIKKYIALFDLADDDYLFCTAEHTRLANRSMQDNVAEYNRMLGVDKTSIHLFRHTFAKNYYKTTKDIYSLCRLLGHQNVAITQEYLRDLYVDIDDAIAYNPQQQFVNKETKRRRGKLK